MATNRCYMNPDMRTFAGFLRVNSGKARPEHFTSAFHPMADLPTDAVGGPLCAKSGHGAVLLAHADNRCSLSLDRPAECAEIPLASRRRDAIGRHTMTSG